MDTINGTEIYSIHKEAFRSRMPKTISCKLKETYSKLGLNSSGNGFLQSKELVAV